MAKLEGYSRVVVINYERSTTPYYFAIYEDENNYKIGDVAVLSSGSFGRIVDIISSKSASEKFTKNIISEVIGKVDISAYEKRIEQRKQKEQLKKELDKRKKEIQKKLDDEYYASKDETYAEMLRQYESL